MKKSNCIFIFILILLLLGSCTSNNASDLKFYVVSKAYINDGMTDSKIINTAKEQGRLVFDGEDIVGYNWQSHTVTLSEDAVSTIGSTTTENGGSALFKVDDSYAFVLILGKDLIYAGGFKSGTKTPDIPLQPFIKDETRYSFSIQFDEKYANYKDNRSNNKLYKFLEYQGLLSTN